ncbi:FG-GAP repeat protein [Planctomycetes bacterium Pla163]|uniref:FG-GAP repeat protein n=1 Tax=Rohdeia mirabilis TaxID=2528008 RepID=A0A518CZA0_9BACT|nr:FG-GAP repeat protein [Planctomycetes bacterium Pla163]
MKQLHAALAPVPTGRNSFHPAVHRRGASAAALLVGVLVAGAAAVVAWKLSATDSVIVEADDTEVEQAITEGLGTGEVKDLVVDSTGPTPLLSDLIAESQLNSGGAGRGVDLSRTLQELSKDPALFKSLVEEGQIRISPTAQELFASGGVIPAHWIRAIDGVIHIADPGSSSPAYAAVAAPRFDALPFPDPTLAAAAQPAGPVPVEGARFGPNGLPVAGTWRGKPAFSDLDGDGDLDLIGSLRVWGGGDKGEGLHVWLNEDGGARWVESTKGMRRDLGYGGADVADLDGDGATDLAFACHNGYPRAYLSRMVDGELTWQESSTGLEGMGVCTDVALGDLTGDGVPELACMGFFSGTGGMYVYSYDRERDVWFVLAELLDPNEYGYQVRTHDFDGDGTLDLLATTSVGVVVFSYRDGAFENRSAGLDAPVVGGTLMQVLPVDLQGDGVCELLVLGWHTTQDLPMTLHAYEDGAWRQLDVDLPSTESFDDGEFVELDGDAGHELYLLGREGALIAEMDAKGNVTPIARIGEKVSHYHAQVADLDGDGLDEGVVFEQGGVRLLDLAGTLAGFRESQEKP